MKCPNCTTNLKKSGFFVTYRTDMKYHWDEKNKWSESKLLLSEDDFLISVTCLECNRNLPNEVLHQVFSKGQYRHNPQSALLRVLGRTPELFSLLRMPKLGRYLARR